MLAKGTARRLLVGGLLALAAACHAKSYSPSTGSGGDGGGGDDGGAPCNCTLPSGAGDVVIPCGGTGCADNVSYLCTDLGTALPGMLCGPSDAAIDGPGNCVTSCTGKTCNGPDNCGGLCKCATGVQCNPSGVCGNGCDLALGDVCSEDAGTPSTCCATGLTCLVGDSGVGICG